MKRLWTGYVSTAANTNEQVFEIDTEDDYRVRHVKSIFVGIAVSGVKLGLYVQGQLYSTIDCTRFAAGDQVVYVDYDAQPQMPLKFAFTDLSGTARNNIPVIVGYDVDPGTGP